MVLLAIVSLALTSQSLSVVLDEGIRRYWNGEYEATVLVLEPACATNASSGEKLECHKYLAFSHVALGSDEQALAQFTQLLELDAGYRLDASLVSPKILVRFENARKELAATIYRDGKLAYQGDDFAHAIDRFERSLELDPANELAAEYRELAAERQQLSEAAMATAPATPSARVSEPTAAPKPVAELEDKVYRLTSDINRPVLVERVPPEYPRAARNRRIEGSVVISVVIDRSGSVGNPKVIRTVDPHLDQAAVRAVQKWRYRPATLDGFPVAVYGIIELSFQLEGG